MILSTKATNFNVVLLVMLGGIASLFYQNLVYGDGENADVDSPQTKETPQHNPSSANISNRLHRFSTTASSTANFTNPNDIFVVGIMFSGKPRYFDSLHAQSETWLRAFPAERIFAVGPTSITGDENERPNKDLLPRIIASKCPDRELWCKRIQHITESYKLLQSGIHFDWVLSGNEDWYVHLPAMRKAFKNKNATEPAVYTSLGCAIHWKYQPSSKNGTVPRPQGRRQDNPNMCEQLKMYGGSCGGIGIVFSRGAIELMMADGEKALWNTTKSLPFDWKHSHPQDDNVLSCLVYTMADSGIPIQFKGPPWRAKGGADAVKNGVGSGERVVATLHAVPNSDMSAADIIKGTHSKFPNDTETIFIKV